MEEEIKTLKFRPKLIPLVLNGTKKVTYRLFDDKNLKEGNQVSLLNWVTKEQFGTAKIISIKKIKFGELKETDMQEHEEYKNKEEMYKTYSIYYKCKVNKDTPLKVIKFEIIK